MSHQTRLATVFVLVAIGLSGCFIPLFESANLVGPLPAYGGQYLIRVEEVRGPPKVHGGHAFGMIARTMYVHTIWLPRPPDTKTTYRAQELTLEEMTENGQREKYIPSGGALTVDKDSKTVIVDLQIKTGPFSGNGTYPLKIQ
jgi:hypothetical protein